jgi:hypothetical protein
MIVEQKFEPLWNSTRVNSPMKSRINYSADNSRLRVSARIARSHKVHQMYFPIRFRKVTGTSMIITEGLCTKPRYDDRSRLLFVAARPTEVRAALLSASYYVYLQDIPFSFFCRTRMQHPCSFARKLHAPFSSAPGIKSMRGVRHGYRVCRGDNSVMDGQGQRANG